MAVWLRWRETSKEVDPNPPKSYNNTSIYEGYPIGVSLWFKGSALMGSKVKEIESGQILEYTKQRLKNECLN